MKDPLMVEVCTSRSNKLDPEQIQEEVKKRGQEKKADSVDCLPGS
jgi:hypothetical protein